MKFGATIPVYNREQYIGPYLEQMLAQNIECVVNLSKEPWSHGGNQESMKADRTELILSKFFPDVKVNKGIFSHHKDSMNAGLRDLKHCDRVFVQDCDMFLTKDVFNECFKFLESTDSNVYAVNFETMFIEYYYNYNYGKGAIPGGVPPILAIKPPTEMENMIKATDSDVKTWDDPRFKIHHFRFAKANGSGKHFCNEPTANLHDYTPAPQEIIDLLTKWEKILENL